MLHEFPEEFKIAYRKLTVRENDTVLMYQKNQILTGGDLKLPKASDLFSRSENTLGPEDFTYLFTIGEERFFTAFADTEPFGEFTWQPIRLLRNAEPQYRAFASTLGEQIHVFYQKNRFCGRCGEKTVPDEKERMLRCPKCGNLIYPQICPSVIVGILHKGKILATRYSTSHISMTNGSTQKASNVGYALVAGYIESGESGEMCVQREVMEEVGLKVKNIRYFASQPWPFSGAFLLGYFCELDGDADQVTLEEDELSEAVWLSPEEMPDRSKDTAALTSAMMEAFRTGKVTETA